MKATKLITTLMTTAILSTNCLLASEVEFNGGEGIIEAPTTFLGGVVTNRKGAVIGLTCADEEVENCEYFNFVYKSAPTDSYDDVQILNPSPLSLDDMKEMVRHPRYSKIPSFNLFKITKHFWDCNGDDGYYALLATGFGAMIASGGIVGNAIGKKEMQDRLGDARRPLGITAGVAVGLGTYIGWSTILDLAIMPIKIPVKAIQRLVTRLKNRNQQNKATQYRAMILKIESANRAANKSVKLSMRQFTKLRERLENL